MHSSLFLEFESLFVQSVFAGGSLECFGLGVSGRTDFRLPGYCKGVSGFGA